MRPDRAFYEGDTLAVTRALIGCTLFRRTEAGLCAGRIVEAEAYLGPRDDAAHSYRGRTRRVRVQYEGSGLAYIYMIYGLHRCFNITSGPADAPEAILIRALEPLTGLEVMAERSGGKTDKLCTGPGRLCRAMGLDRSLTGTFLLEGDFYLAQGETVPEEQILSSPRIGIDYAGEDRDRPWRYFLRYSPYVSRPQPKRGGQNAGRTRNGAALQ